MKNLPDQRYIEDPDKIYNVGIKISTGKDHIEELREFARDLNRSNTIRMFKEIGHPFSFEGPISAELGISSIEPSIDDVLDLIRWSEGLGKEMKTEKINIVPEVVE